MTNFCKWTDVMSYKVRHWLSSIFLLQCRKLHLYTLTAVTVLPVKFNKKAKERDRNMDIQTDRKVERQRGRERWYDLRTHTPHTCMSWRSFLLYCTRHLRWLLHMSQKKKKNERKRERQNEKEKEVELVPQHKPNRRWVSHPVMWIFSRLLAGQVKKNFSLRRWWGAQLSEDPNKPPSLSRGLWKWERTERDKVVDWAGQLDMLWGRWKGSGAGSHPFRLPKASCPGLSLANRHHSPKSKAAEPPTSLLSRVNY